MSRLPLSLILVMACSSSFTYATDYLESERIVVKSAEDEVSPMEAPYEEAEEERQRFLDRLRERRAKQSSFRRDSSLTYKARMYDFKRETFDGENGNYLTAGGELEYQSGKWKDFFSAGLTYAVSTDLSIGQDEVSVGALKDDGGSINVLSEAYVKLERQRFTATLYRQSLNFPYLNRNDIRMIPNTFEAYRLDHDGEKLDWTITYADKIKLKDDDGFISMADAAGAESEDSGVAVVGAIYTTDRFHVGAINLHAEDLFNIFYAETNIEGKLSETIDYQAAAQLTHQDSIGREAIGDISARMWGLKVSMSWKHIVFKLAYTTNDGDTRINSPWGGSPHYNSVMIQDFDRANESATGITLAYTLDRWQLPSWSVNLKYTDGKDARKTNGDIADQQEESDITIDYKPSSGRLKDLWIRFRYAEVERGDDTRRDFRMIVNYPLKLL